MRRRSDPGACARLASSTTAVARTAVTARAEAPAARAGGGSLAPTAADLAGDSADGDSAPTGRCPHLRRPSVQALAALRDPVSWSCVVCGSTDGAWLCLACGFVGCSRLAGGHARHHHYASGAEHSVVFDLATRSSHCYSCGDWIIADGEEGDCLSELRATAEKIEAVLPLCTRSDDVLPEAEAACEAGAAALATGATGWTAGDVDGGGKCEDGAAAVTDGWLAPRGAGEDGPAARVGMRRRRDGKGVAGAAPPGGQTAPLGEASPRVVRGRFGNGDRRSPAVALPAARATPGPAAPVRGRRVASAAAPVANAARRVRTGLRNLGNTCYVNAVLQALAHTPSFCDFFLDFLGSQAPLTLGSPSAGVAVSVQRQDTAAALAAAEARPQPAASLELCARLHSLLRVLRAGRYATCAPLALVSSIWAHVGAQFRRLRQHDAQEFLTFLLDRLDSELRRTACPSFVRDHFVVGLDQTVTCARCGAQSTTQLTQLGLLLRVPSRGESAAAAGAPETRTGAGSDACGGGAAGEGGVATDGVGAPETAAETTSAAARVDGGAGAGAETGRGAGAGAAGTGATSAAGDKGRPPEAVPLEDLLKALVTPEGLDGDNSYACARCGRLERATRAVVLARAPPVLVINLGRTLWTRGGGKAKVLTPVRFPLRDLRLDALAGTRGKVAASARTADGGGRQAGAAPRGAGAGAGDGVRIGASPAFPPPPLPLATAPISSVTRAPHGQVKSAASVVDNLWYDLVAVITHQGQSLDVGHYASLCLDPNADAPSKGATCCAARDTASGAHKAAAGRTSAAQAQGEGPRANPWALFNDVRVTPVSEMEVERSGMQAVMLFYAARTAPA